MTRTGIWSPRETEQKKKNRKIGNKKAKKIFLRFLGNQTEMKRKRMRWKVYKRARRQRRGERNKERRREVMFTCS